MNKLTELFSKPSQDVWVDLLRKELKAVPLEQLDNVQELEGLAVKAYQYNRTVLDSNPGVFPFTRGFKSNSNTWLNRFDITVHDEKSANIRALEVLMQGIDCLHFILKSDKPNLAVLLEGIDLPYIRVEFQVETKNQFDQIEAHFQNGIPSTVAVMLQSGHSSYTELSKLIAPHVEVEINAYALQAAGANIQDQLAYALSDGHEVFLALVAQGIPADTAYQQIHFSFGIGANYLNEISKIRAFRSCWSQLITAYLPSINLETKITAQIGHLNKSLADPHTNLLRQTTEALSAVSGGVDILVIHPYDSLSENGSSKLAERMARNIPLILQEESYLNAVVDPLGGSYVIDDLTHQIQASAWKRFLELDSLGGIRTKHALENLQQTVQETAAKRLQAVETKTATYIGINTYMNPTPQAVKRVQEESLLGFKKIYLEDYSAQ